jgi:filamentous hemagglutinin
MSVSMKTTTARVALGTVLMGAVPMAPLVPTAIAQAIAQVIADPNAAAANRPTMHESLNKTPVQNIVAPNASGLSHNKLQEFNVDQRNLIINNSRVNAISNLGGAVVANPNLANGEARIILNEVTGGNRSILQGNQELLGGRAAYILANPNGITCAGCGFLNFPRVTMTTGVPVINGDVLNGFRVNGGDISIGGAGLNAEGIDAFDILTRSVTFAGQVNTRALNVVAGRNDVDYDTLAATALTDAPATPAPSWAIDSSALGGMYAGRIGSMPFCVERPCLISLMPG